MKKILFFIAVLFGFNAVAQNTKKVQGPEAKNYKYWEHKKVPTIITLNSFEKLDLKGPEFKNLKIWERKLSDNKIVLARNTKIRKVTGPKAKNYKPWQN
ncbi:hypothetical protein FDT66_05810 [Polaribacter aestuariivivens]|uniref:Uncharacterized protein n=1 Tax=Polaribacter aestuariivivens TaxID=2304626 RepID=A0A5S3N8G6_9FLAO|nr:hypothetical protein [Polaribacter aestuariivivens]TMM31477.1 hypothetical protein FDT66_05810 [Polaribacter aestuariivivens]